MTQDNQTAEPKPRKTTESQRQARRSNMVKFRESVGGKTALRHGCQSVEVKATGKLPVGFEHLQPIVDEFYSGWVADLGGQENLTAAERALLLVCRGCLAIWLLGLEHVRTHGLVDADNEAQSVLKVIGTFANSLRLNLVACGLERSARRIGPSTLEEYLEIRSKEAEAAAPTAESTEPAQQ